MTRVLELGRPDAGRWDEFVLRHPQATFFHRAGWQRVIEGAFGHRTHYLFAERDGRVAGVLPLAEVKSLLFGHSLASLPFVMYGGVVADDEEARRALDEAACERARRLGVDHLEYRSMISQHPDWAQKSLYATFRKALPEDPEQVLAQIPRKQRAVVRKGIAAGLAGEIDEGTERLFRAYSLSLHRLGTPMFPRRYFRLLKEVFGKDCEVLTITRSGQMVASVMSFYFRDQVLPYYAGSTDEARDCGAHDFMYWDLMRRACGRGIRVFDYGRSKVDSGPYNFKKNWGFVPEPLHYEYLLVRGKAVPDLNPASRKYRLLVKMWQRLPLPVANFIGPHIVKSLA